MSFHLKQLLFTFFLFCGAEVRSQDILLSGTIQDAHTKEPVSYASVYFTRSGIGKTSDSAGNFSFQFSQKVRDTLVISYVGYALMKIPVDAFANGKRLIIQLERGGATNEVIIKSKFNKGLFLWRKIMSKKKFYNRYNLTNFGYEAYNKLEIDLKNFNAYKAKRNFILKPFSFIFDHIDSTSEKVPFLPAYLLENMSDYAYQHEPKKFFENIKASNQKGFKNESISRFMGVMDQNVNIYNNFVIVIDKDFISPFNDNADTYYIFSVPDTQYLADKRRLLHFVFRPKRAGQNTFEGDAWVLDKTYQIQKISLYLGKEANINYIDRISVFQEFLPINDSVYFLNRDKFFADFKLLGKHTLTFIGRKTTSYRNIIINNDSITNLFRKQPIQEVIRIEPNVNEKNDAYWKTIRHDSLSVNEKAIYFAIDKLLEMPKFKKLQKTLRFLGTGYRNIGYFEIGPWYNWISSSSWEGTRFRFDLGNNTKFSKDIYLHGYLAYGTLDNKFKGKAEGYWILSRKPKRTRIHFSYSDDIDNGITQYGEVSQDNLFSFLLRKPSTSRKFIQVKDTRLELYRELGKGFSTEWFFTHLQFDPLKNLPVKSSFPVSSGNSLTNFEVALRLRFAYLEKFVEGDYFRYTLGSPYPIVEMILAKGFPGVMNSAYSYTRISASVHDNVKISPYGTLSYKAYAGKINGALPFTFLENHAGNDLNYYYPSSLNLMNRFEYLSDKYAGINLEHNVGSGLFRFIPFTRKLKWRQFWNAKALWGSLSAENQTINNAAGTFKSLNGKTYMEMGTGIDNILKIFRVDLVWRLLPSTPNDIRSSRFGVFGSFQFQF